jgi:hypothetical protein
MPAIQQTIEIPANHRLTIDVPREVPAGRVILTYTPAAVEKSADSDTEYLHRKALEEQSIEIINRNADRLNREMEDVLSYQELDL